jgi:outer membrane lipoprotein SlyB
MRRASRLATAVVTLVMIAAGCAHSQSPVLYPNAKLKEAGKAQADAEISACRSLADDYVSSGTATAKEIGKDTAAGGAGGAAVGAVAGAVSGGGAGRGAAIGAATGATAGAVHGTFKSSGPSPVYKNFVDRCLRERGYEVIGWQ